MNECPQCGLECVDDDYLCHYCQEQMNACGDLYCEECDPECPDYEGE